MYAVSTDRKCAMRKCDAEREAPAQVEGEALGRVRLCLNRGFPRCLGYDATPYGIG
jgi:hypothetical protein